MAILAFAALLLQDVPKRHVEEVERAAHAYVVVHGGTVDGRSFRSPMGVYEGWTQDWESNRELRMENVGDTDVVNPWISNGRNGFRTIPEIIASAVKPGMSEREKALAIYAQEIRHRWHWGGNNDELGDVVKVFNVYGHNTCGNDSMCLAALWSRAGLKARGACLVGHCVSEVFFDGRWNLMDGDGQGLYLLRDGRTIASELDLARDHDLVKRTHTLGPLRRADRRGDEWQAALYVMEGGERYPRDGYARHSMDMTLRPGEALVWRWARSSKPKALSSPGIKFPATVCNGLWDYRPRLPAGGLAGPAEWAMKSPYVYVGGKLEADAPGASFEISFDGKSWTKTGPDLDPHFPSAGPPRYAYRLRCSLPDGVRLASLRVLNDVQMAPLAMPELVLGENRLVYTDATSGARKVRITHEWTERSSMRPPAAPAAALRPPDGGASAGTRVVFAWEPAKDPDGDRIADYHFELSDRPDFAYPLSSNFNRLVSKLAPRLEESFALPRAGLLAPGGRYFWRIRARDAKGAWGPWSKTWSFKAGGPAVPLDPKVGDDGVLRWTPNPAGSRPAKYRVYGSDEKGFSASDEPYAALGAKEEFAANFVAESPKPELDVLGPGRSNRAFYRVVAVDAAGEWSADSDLAESPRPFVVLNPPPAARVGRAFTHAVATIRSLGDVRARDGSKLEMRYWDVERPRFSIEEGPAWLRIDAATGALSGTPDAPGRVKVRVAASLELEERRIDARALSWGQDKSLGTSMKTLGKALREFMIEVGP